MPAPSPHSSLPSSGSLVSEQGPGTGRPFPRVGRARSHNFVCFARSRSVLNTRGLSIPPAAASWPSHAQPLPRPASVGRCSPPGYRAGLCCGFDHLSVLALGPVVFFLKLCFLGFSPRVLTATVDLLASSPSPTCCSLPTSSAEGWLSPCSHSSCPGEPLVATGGARGSPGLCGQECFRTTEQETSGFSAYVGCPRDVLLMTGIWCGGGCAPDLQRVRCPGEA